jgi:DNA-binding transcriptional regulator YiaG
MSRVAISTPTDLLQARERLQLTAADLGRTLRLPGRTPGRMVRYWEKGAHPIPGPVCVAVELLVERHQAQKAARRAADALPAYRAAMAPETPQEPPAALPAAPATLKTRRRG